MHRFQHLEATGSNPIRVFYFKAEAGTFNAFTFYLKRVVGSFAYFFVFFFISMKFMYANRTSPDVKKSQHSFDGLTGIDKYYSLVICNHGTQAPVGD